MIDSGTRYDLCSYTQNPFDSHQTNDCKSAHVAKMQQYNIIVANYVYVYGCILFLSIIFNCRAPQQEAHNRDTILS